MGGESIKPIRKRIHVYFLMTTYTQYQNNEHRIVEHQLSLLGFTYAFNDMQEQFNRISSKTY